jgi:hypothetical protein
MIENIRGQNVRERQHLFRACSQCMHLCYVANDDREIEPKKNVFCQKSFSENSQKMNFLIVAFRKFFERKKERTIVKRSFGARCVNRIKIGRWRGAPARRRSRPTDEFFSPRSKVASRCEMFDRFGPIETCAPMELLGAYRSGLIILSIMAPPYMKRWFLLHDPPSILIGRSPRAVVVVGQSRT